jgi:hypothetical protein
MQGAASRISVDRLLATYKNHHHELLQQDPTFAKWLEEDYVPVAGGWMY